MPNHPQSELDIPVGVQGLAGIVCNRRRYIDKTSYITSWISKGAGTTNIIHRPRRFGKTLTFSVIEALYSHQKHLFKDTSLPDSFWNECPHHPVISFTLAVRPGPNTLPKMEISVRKLMINEMKRLKIYEAGDEKLPKEELLETAIDRLVERDPDHLPVILIDEYDSLLTYAYERGENLAQAAEQVADYIYPLKYKYKEIHATYVIGIMKYQGLKLMSAVNNPLDVTFDAQYAQMIGFTMEEIQIYFPREIEKLAGIHEMSIEEMLDKIKNYYNGYCFSGEAIGKTVYAGFSFCTFATMARYFADFWYSTGGIKTIYKYSQSQLPEIESLMDNGSLTVPMAELLQGHNTQLSEEIALHTLLYYHGYLTLHSSEGGNARLVIPNEEVLRSLHRSFAENVLKLEPNILAEGLALIKSHVKKQEVEPLIYQFAYLIANLPGKLHMHAERYYQTVIVTLLFCLYGREVRAEQPVASGIPDIVLLRKEVVYLFELKFLPNNAKAKNKKNDASVIASLEAAKEQIISKRYVELYRNVPAIYAIALVVSQQEHNIVGYMVVEAPKNNPAFAFIDKPQLLLPEKIQALGAKRAYYAQANLPQTVELIDPQEPYVIPVSEERIEEFNRHKREFDETTQPGLELEKQLIIAQADLKVEKAHAALEAEKAHAAALKVEKMQMKLLLLLQKQNIPSEEICRIAEFTAEEWKDLTGEKINLDSPKK